jgi:predicted TIM-barrel fold metal-dependent hydrolase
MTISDHTPEAAPQQEIRPMRPRRAAFGRISRPDEAWLARLQPEAAIEPDLPILDAHHHLWRKPDWIYGLPEFQADIASGHQLVGTIFIEAHSQWHEDGPEELRPVGETMAVARAAAEDPRVATGIVAYADLRLGDRVAPVLEAHRAAADVRLCGIRQQATWDDDPVIGHGAPCPGLLRRDDFRSGLARLAPLDLVFDLWVFHHQLAEAAEIARAFPQLRFVLGHCGGPLGYGRHAGQRSEVFAAWHAGMAELARCPNVAVKLGGLTMRLAAFDYGVMDAPPPSEELARLWAPVIESCITLFGADRCMFESNFPVEKMGVGYGTLWNAFKRIAQGASEAEKRALFAGSAKRIYGL